jgi:outer membrane protein OmpA-like peptidoglycan-associated protein
MTPGQRDLRYLQRAAGNAATSALLRGQVQRCGPERPDCGCPENVEVPAVQRAADSAERAFGEANDGRVDGVEGTDIPVAEADEFVLWNFRVGDQAVRPGHTTRLQSTAARWAKEFAADPLLRVRVVGNASKTGGAGIAEPLARRRAEAVRDFLAGQGVPRERIDTEGSGARQPLATGDDPESLARNRRVELSKYVATTIVAPSDLAAKVTSGDFRFAPRQTLANAIEGDNFRSTLGRNVATIAVTVDGDPAVTAGLIQYLVADTRRASYVAADGKTGGLDAGHCVGGFLPCRDVLLARLPFSFEGAGRTTTSREATTDLILNDAPGVAFPLEVALPGGGKGRLAGAEWSMTFVIVLAARQGARFAPLQNMSWRVDGVFSFPPGRGIPDASSATVTQGAKGPGAPPGLDIAAAMSHRSCRLLTRVLAKDVCVPVVV